MPVASMDGDNYLFFLFIYLFFLHVINKEKSCDQDGLNQARVRSVCKTKYFPLLIWMKEQTLSVRVQN